MAVSLAIISPFISFTFLFSIVGFFIMLTIFNEFTAVFFDLKDSELILPTPIKPESLSIGKNLFLLIIFLKYSIALSLPSIIFYGYYFNIFITFPILVMLIFEMLLLISFTAILFGILLKYFSGERLKDFTNYLQIVVSLIMFIGYQLIVRNVDKLVIFFENGISNWFLLFPPAWFAALPSLFFPEIDA
ncbi:MAG: hypothetical protein U9N34_01020, partial [Candidatus Cloacimonadota bacterium]|nr:hypothetical protein [Candidatus Cloacimonadota bacterium]